MKKSLLLVSLICLTINSFAQKNRIQLTANEAQHRVEVTVDGKPFTAYWYPGPAVLKKPVLYPIRSAGGQFVTRGWPTDPRPGERVDHPHHVGMWLNYGDVNGDDFWNNSTEVTDQPDKKLFYGTIVHTGIVSMKSGKNQAELTVTADWINHAGQPVLRERTIYVFQGQATTRTIDRQTTLTALATDVVFKDNKEGLIGLRVARELEHPAGSPDRTKAETFTDASGKPTTVPVLNNAGVTGQYKNADGITGEAVWGKRSPWMTLTGTLADEAVTLTLLDHPQNLTYPTYWHARGYGLFAANPLGPSVFSAGKDAALNYTLQAGKSVTFRYRLVIASGANAGGSATQLAEQFGAGK